MRGGCETTHKNGLAKQKNVPLLICKYPPTHPLVPISFFLNLVKILTSNVIAKISKEMTEYG